MKLGSWAEWAFCLTGGGDVRLLGKGGHSPGNPPGLSFSWHLLSIEVPFHPKQSSSMRPMEYRRNDSAWFLRSEKACGSHWAFSLGLLLLEEATTIGYLGSPTKTSMWQGTGAFCQQRMGESVSRQSSLQSTLAQTDIFWGTAEPETQGWAYPDSCHTGILGKKRYTMFL